MVLTCLQTVLVQTSTFRIQHKFTSTDFMLDLHAMMQQNVADLISL